MDQNILFVIIGGASLLGGLLVGKIVFARNTKKQVEEAEAQAANILKETELRAETIKKEKQLEAKERFVQLKSEYDRDLLEKNKKIGEAENRIKQKELTINQKEVSLDKQVKDNNIRRAQGEMQLQREQLAQGNLSSQFDLGQQQFNAGAVNSASQFSANARNQAAAFKDRKSVV